MQINEDFIWRDSKFWSAVRLVSETIGYSERRKKWDAEWRAKRYCIEDIQLTFSQYDIQFEDKWLFDDVLTYLNFRSDVLETDIRPNLMNKIEAKSLYENMLREFPNTLPVHMNKQKWKKSHPNYLVNMVNMGAYSVIWDDFDPDPLKLGIYSNDTWLLKTLPRRMDGAVPSTHNPYLIWEIKEYYNTTTFGSRIADGVYETMLVWNELTDLEVKEWVKINHILFTDNYLTWWIQWKSYLCRFVDIVHMWLIDQVFFWREVYTKWPEYLASILPTQE